MARFMKDGLGRLSAALIAMLAILGLNSAAFAVEIGLGDGNPNLSKPGSITVHKYKTPAQGNLGAANGKEIEGAPAEGKLSGVEFSVQKVDLDLSVSSNWNKVAGLTFDGATVKSGDDTFDLTGDVTTKETAEGVATFSNLAAGVYLVKEGADNGNNNITSKAAPFFVTIPMPDTTEKTKPGWIYDVHVYPKNSVTTVKKTVDDSKAYDGEDYVTWSITATIPKLGPEETEHSHLVVKDKLDSRLIYDEKSTMTVTIVNADETEVIKTLTEGTEKDQFAFTKPTADNENTLTVEVKKPGETLSDLDLNKVKVTFTTRVKNTGEDGVINNDATVFFNDPETSTGVKTESVNTKWGWIQITKVDQDNQKKLSGAEFTVYLTKDDANKGLNPITTFTSGKDGIAKVMLKAGENGTTYFVKETKAPAGYVLSDEVHEMKVTAGKTATGTALKEVKNVKQTVPELPITGAAGTLLLTIGGSAVLLAALGTAFVAMRRRARA